LLAKIGVTRNAKYLITGILLSCELLYNRYILNIPKFPLGDKYMLFQQCLTILISYFLFLSTDMPFRLLSTVEEIEGGDIIIDHGKSDTMMVDNEDDNTKIIDNKEEGLQQEVSAVLTLMDLTIPVLFHIYNYLGETQEELINLTLVSKQVEKICKFLVLNGKLFLLSQSVHNRTVVLV
jgi:hypothetical protein